jgi:asparagine synthase (glutamine-hydrolysing)
MAHSLETRCPFLDYRVVEFAARLPTRFKVNRFSTKHLLKKYAADLLPVLSVNRRKQGFSVPIGAWLRGPLRRPLEALLGQPRFAARGYVRPDAVRACIARHVAGEDHGEKLWALLCLELWFRMFIDRDLGKDDRLRDLG